MLVMQDFLRQLGRTAIMGIVNATGDSFSENADSAPESAVDRGCALAEAGADILDIGGESTRPGAGEISAETEISRVIPVLKELKKRLPQMAFSIDTRHAAVAAAALEAGAQIINDVSMLSDPEMAAVIARYQAALIIGHFRAAPEIMQNREYCNYPDGVAVTVAAELAAAKKSALAAGVLENNILLDPGIGFSKTAGQCWELLRDLATVAPLPALAVGISRKSFLGWVSGEKEPAKRLGESLAIELELASAKTAIIRTHAVRELHNALSVATYFRRLKEK